MLIYSFSDILNFVRRGFFFFFRTLVAFHSFSVQTWIWKYVVIKRKNGQVDKICPETIFEIKNLSKIHHRVVTPVYPLVICHLYAMFSVNRALELALLELKCKFFLLHRFNKGNLNNFPVKGWCYQNVWRTKFTGQLKLNHHKNGGWSEHITSTTEHKTLISSVWTDVNVIRSAVPHVLLGFFCVFFVFRLPALTWSGSFQQLCMWFWEETCLWTADSTPGCWVRNRHKIHTLICVINWWKNSIILQW